MLVGPGIARNSRPARTAIFSSLPCSPDERSDIRGGHTKIPGSLRSPGLRRGNDLLRGPEQRGKLLSSGLAAAGGFGVIDRAEPARALDNVHLDFRVPAAGWPVINAFARAVDVALDGAIGRRRDRTGGRRQQDSVGVRRRLERAEEGGLLVADAPVPRRDERA